MIHLFSIIDIDNNGTITWDEFVDAIERLQGGLPIKPTSSELVRTFKTLDTNKDGVIDLPEFVHAFKTSQTVREINLHHKIKRRNPKSKLFDLIIDF